MHLFCSDCGMLCCHLHAGLSSHYMSPACRLAFRCGVCLLFCQAGLNLNQRPAACRVHSQRSIQPLEVRVSCMGTPSRQAGRDRRRGSLPYRMGCGAAAASSLGRSGTPPWRMGMTRGRSRQARAGSRLGRSPCSPPTASPADRRR